MGAETHITAISDAIQLAIAPVFLLTAIGTIINALTGRLARAVDRRRTVEEILPAYEGEKRATLELELRILSRRTLYVIRAIAFAVLSAIFVCLLIGASFAAAITSVELTRAVATLFILAMIALTIALVLFMREVWLAAQSVHPSAWPHPVLAAEDERTQATAAPK